MALAALLPVGVVAQAPAAPPAAAPAAPPAAAPAAPPAAAPAAPPAAAPAAVAPAVPQAVKVGAPTAAELIDLGRRTYTLTCARCHGLNLVSNGLGFDLRTFPADDKARFVRSVTQGLRAMPALGAAVSPVQLEALWAYVGSVNGWPPAVDGAKASAPAK